MTTTESWYHQSTEAKPEPLRDRYGRYLLVPPDGGERVAHRRVTTVSSALDDRRGLESYFKRCVAVGMLERPDLATLIASHGPTIQSRVIDPLIEQVEEAAKASKGAKLGEALHRFCERVDRGEAGVKVPAEHQADIDAYLAATEGWQWLVIEDVVVLDSLTVAGMPDRVAILPDGRVVVADIKTGQGDARTGMLKYGWLAMGIQVGLYSRAEAIYSLVDDQRRAFPVVDQDVGVIIHLPAGEGRCHLWELDIAQGWEDAQLALQVLNRRSHQAKLATQMVPGSLQRPAKASRLSAVPELPDVALAGTQTPVLPPQPMTGRALARMVLDARNASDEETQMANPAQVQALEARYLVLPDEARQWIGAVKRSATSNDVNPSRLHISSHPSQKRYAIGRALVLLAETGRLDDEYLRDVIALLDSALAQPVISVGAALAALTTDEAMTFLAMAEDLAEGNPL